MRGLNAQLERMLDREASTRPVALLRIGLAMLTLSRFADQMVLGSNVDGVRAALLFAFWPATLAMLVGFHSRLATGLTALVLVLCAYRFGHVQHEESWNHHHVYLLVAATLLTAFTPCGRSYSFDRFRALTRAPAAGQPPPAERGLVWAQHLIGAQLSAVYFWGAVNKCNQGWLRGDKFESQLLFHIFDSDPPDLPGFHTLLLVLSVGTVVLEFALAFGLWSRAARRFLIPAGIAFHVFIYMTLPVTIFSALSCLLYLAYFDPDDVHRAIDRMSGS